MKFLDLFLQLILFFLSYIVPKKKSLFLFWSGTWKDFKWNTKYLFLYWLKNIKNLDFYWITKNKKIFKMLKDENYPVLYKYSFKWFFYIIRANILFVEINSQDCYYIDKIFWRFYFFNLWHWTPIKKIWDDMVSDNIWLGSNFFYKIRKIFWKKLKSSSKFSFISATSLRVQKLFQFAFDNKNVFVTWYPRNDIFFDKSLILDNFDKKLNFRNYKKIITYVPTFRDKNSISPFWENFLSKLDKYLKDNEYLFIIKLHPFDESLLFDFQKFENIKNLDKSIDLQEILVFTDILITDYSSVMFDFILTQKPILYYCFDYEFYVKNCRWLYINYYNDLPWPFAKTENELFDLLKNIDNIFLDFSYKQNYKIFNDKFNQFKDWNSCKRIFDLVLNSK